jgi:hypothetical protein
LVVEWTSSSRHMGRYTEPSPLAEEEAEEDADEVGEEDEAGEAVDDAMDAGVEVALVDVVRR